MHYLDNAATTQVDPAVIEVITQTLQQHFANSSALYTPAAESEQVLEASRKTVAAAMGCDPQELIFTASGSEGNNIALWGAAFARRNWAKEIVISGYEHASLLHPANQLGALGYHVRFVEPDADGIITPKAIADAVAAGVQGFPPIDALAALVESSVADEPGLISFRENGCVIEDDGAESVAGTLEYAYDDWCIAQIARTLMAAIKEGNTRQALENIYDRFMASAQNWRNVFDPKTGTLRSRRNGQWGASSPAVFVPHDIMGLMRAMGGPTAFRARLDSLTKDIKGFPESMQYIPGLYALAGRQDVCDTLVERLMGECFRNAPDGLDGSDEFGQMSAWYVLNALGEYSLCPGSSGPQKTWVAKTIVVNPVFVMESDVVVDSLQVGIGNIDVGCKAWYTIDGGEAIPYEGPFEITGPCMLECWAENQAGLRSFINKCQIYGVQ